MRVRIGRFYSGAPEAIGVHAELDIPLLVESGAFLQAASGYGKTTLLVEVVEATHPHIQQIIIDPEGEFSPLRANHDFVIAAARGGDALAHPRTAGLLATRLLETKASAILDIYDLKPRDRHAFVREFIESLMNAAKDLWHPVLVILDEAHLFCPEKGFGESEATDAVIDLAGRGRKRGFRLVAATQRIAKFNKNAAAELHTKFIGYAGIDMDVKRAAFELGLQPRDALAQLRKLKPGEFYAFGPALHVLEPCLFRSELPQTKLPKAGKRKLVSPPKPTDKIRALLPQLADLPREAEQKAKTEQELRKDLAEAQRKLADATRGMVSQDVLKTEIAAAFQRGQERAKAGKAVNYKGAHKEAKVFVRTVEQMMGAAVVELERVLGAATHEWKNTIHHRLHTEGENAMETIRQAAEAQVEISGPPMGVLTLDAKALQKSMRASDHLKPGPITIVPKVPDVLEAIRGDDQLPGPEKKVLTAMAWMQAATGNEWVTQTAAAFMAGYSPGSSSFRNPRSSLAAKGLIEYDSESRIKLTSTGGMFAIHPKARPTANEIQAHVLHLLDGPERKLLEKLLEEYPAGMTQELHAIACNYKPGSSSYRNPRSKLAALDLLRYSGSDVYAEKWLFLE
jgi:uncharacterized protein